MINNDLPHQLANHPVEKLRELVAALPKGSIYYDAACKALEMKSLPPIKE